MGGRSDEEAVRLRLPPDVARALAATSDAPLSETVASLVESVTADTSVSAAPVARSAALRMKMTPEALSRLDEAAAEAGMTRAGWVRHRCAVSRRVWPEPDPARLAGATSALDRAGLAVNAVARTLNATPAARLPAAALGCEDELADALASVRACVVELRAASVGGRAKP